MVWVGGLGPGGLGFDSGSLCNNPFHKGIPGIQTTNPSCVTAEKKKQVLAAQLIFDMVVSQPRSEPCSHTSPKGPARHLCG